MATAAAARMPATYITHGGGPFPVIGGPGHAGLTAFLQQYPKTLPVQPKALLVISAHWEEPVPTVSSAASPDLIYDYHGFPPESYQLKYPAPGSPDLASKVCALLKGAGLECREDPKRGFDHGTFIPLMLMFPQAAIPVVQLSLVSSLDQQLHIRMGEAIAPLREEGVMVVGSGSSFHNMGGLFAAMGDGSSALTPAGRQAQERSRRFDEWLQHATGVTAPELTREQRAALLAAWRKAPEGTYAHPREEHLLPLHVCFGASRPGDKARAVHDDLAMGVKCSSIEFAP